MKKIGVLLLSLLPAVASTNSTNSSNLSGFFEEIANEPWSIAGFVFLGILVILILIRISLIFIDCVVERRSVDSNTAAVQGAVQLQLNQT